MIIDSEGFRVNAYLMQYLKQLSPHVRRNLERGARLGRADRAAAERARAAVRATLESLLADSPCWCCRRWPGRRRCSASGGSR